jgi:uncharacterized protein involved in exopolysaccharide biosynthesis
MIDTPSNPDTDGAHAIRFLFRNRITYLLVLVLAGIGGVIVSAMMTPKYFSYAIVYPAQNLSIESVVDNPVFGYDVEADRLLQIMYSEEILDSCAQKFDLYTKMDLDPNDLESREILKGKFYEEVSFSRSQYVSIVVSATTPDPQLSADIANYIVSLTDGIRSRIYKENLQIVYKSLEKEYQEKLGYVNLLSDSVTALRAQTSVEVLALMNNQIVLKSNNPEASKEQTNLERLINNYMFEQTRVNALAERYNKAKTQYERPSTKVFVVQYAKPTFKQRVPDYPSNVLITILCSLACTTGLLLLSERLKSLNLRD